MMREKCTEKGHGGRGREERSAARSANLGGCKGRAANEGKGKGGGKERRERADDSIALKKKIDKHQNKKTRCRI